jgi:glucose/mannose-6-phosphate isomerase
MKDINKKMLEIVAKFPQDLAAEPEEAMMPESFRPTQLVVCGMGASAAAGLILRDIWSDALPSVRIVRDYTLPKDVGRGALVVACSYSGNTEETLSAFREALSRGCTTAGIAAGGKLLEECKSRGLPYIKVRTGIPPRAAFATLFSALARLVEGVGLIDDAVGQVKAVAAGMDSEKFKTNAKVVASRIEGKIPAIYLWSYEGLAVRVKNQFNENSKIPAKYEMFPELDHNEIEAWSRGKFADGFLLLMLRSEDEPERMRQRIDITKKLISKNVDVLELNLDGANTAERVLGGVFLFDLATIYLGDGYGADTYENDIISDLKKELGSYWG